MDRSADMVPAGAQSCRGRLTGPTWRRATSSIVRHGVTQAIRLAFGAIALDALQARINKQIAG